MRVMCYPCFVCGCVSCNESGKVGHTGEEKDKNRNRKCIKYVTASQSVSQQQEAVKFSLTGEKKNLYHIKQHCQETYGGVAGGGGGGGSLQQHNWQEDGGKGREGEAERMRKKEIRGKRTERQRHG